LAGKNREIKEAKVQDIKAKLGKAQSMIFATYQGLTVEEDTELRKKLREEGVEYKVYKNNLTSLAVKELGFNEINTFLTGPTSIAFSYSDLTAPARVLNSFAKDHKKLELKGGYVQGEVYDVAKVVVLASIPSRDVLISKLLGSLQSPLSKFAYVIDAIAKSKENAELNA